MENLIEKIERYESENKIKYDIAMAKPFNEIVLEFAGIIGTYKSQLEIIKNELKIKQP